MRHVGYICTGIAIAFLGLSMGVGAQDKGKDEKAQTITEKENGSKIKLAKGEMVLGHEPAPFELPE